MEEENSKRMIQCYKRPAEDKSLRNWKKVRHPLRVLFNFLVISSCKFLPDIEFKNRLYRMTGMKVGKNVMINGTNLDIFFPELIEIGDNAVIGAHTTIITHEFHNDGHWRKGSVKIGKNVMIGTLGLVMPGVEIGDNARVAAYSLVNKNVRPGMLVGGVPVREIRKNGFKPMQK
jgi:acetyltransferase-like isoleucine patch superfamily enzyme